MSADRYPGINKKTEIRKLQKGDGQPPTISSYVYNFHESPIGVVPKADGGWRMVLHLSYPPSTSIYHNIDPIHTTVKYTSFDTVIRTISQLGRGAIIPKSDIKSAFRLLRIFPVDFDLSGLQFQGRYYFWCVRRPGVLFEMFSTFLQLLVKEKPGIKTIYHYLNDFIFIGSAKTSQCKILMQNFEELSLERRVPLNIEISCTYY